LLLNFYFNIFLFKCYYYDCLYKVGKMYVFIIRVNCQQKLYNPYVTVYLGDQQYNTCVSGMQEGLWYIYLLEIIL